MKDELLNDEEIFEEEEEGFEDVDDIVTLYDDDGVGFDFQLLDMIPYEGENYAVLYPLDEEEDDGSLVILKAVPGDEDSEEETFVGTDDEGARGSVRDFQGTPRGGLRLRRLEYPARVNKRKRKRDAKAARFRYD